MTRFFQVTVRFNADRKETKKVMRRILLRRFCTAELAGIVVLSIARAARAEDRVLLPPAVSAALHQTVEAQRSGMMWYGQAADRGNSQAAYFVKWLAQAPGNRSFKDENQAAVFDRIAVMRAAAMAKDVESRGLDGRIHPADPAGAAELRAEADRMAREVGLD